MSQLQNCTETCHAQAWYHTLDTLSYAINPSSEAQAPQLVCSQGCHWTTPCISGFGPTAHNSLKSAPMDTTLWEQQLHTVKVHAPQCYGLVWRYQAKRAILQGQLSFGTP